MGEFGQFSCLSDTSANKLCSGGGDLNELVMETDSEALMQAGVKLTKVNWQNFKEGISDHFINHQVGIHHRDFLYRELELDLTKDHTTFDRYGNTGSAALPLTLFKASQKFRAGDKIKLMGIGSGLHNLVMELKWS